MPRKTVLRRRDIIISSALAMLTIVVVLLVQFMAIKPIMQTVQKDKTRLTETVKELEENNKKRRELIQTINSNTNFFGELSVFYERVAPQRGVAAVAADLLNIAKDSSLRILRQQPLDTVEVGQGFLKIPYEFSLQGKFSNFGDFITRLETHPKFIEIAKMDLTREGDIVSAKMTIYIYSTTLEIKEMAPNTVKPPPDPYVLKAEDLPVGPIEEEVTEQEEETKPEVETPPAAEPETPPVTPETPAPKPETAPAEPPAKTTS